MTERADFEARADAGPASYMTRCTAPSGDVSAGITCSKPPGRKSRSRYHVRRRRLPTGLPKFGAHELLLVPGVEVCRSSPFEDGALLGASPLNFPDDVLPDRREHVRDHYVRHPDERHRRHGHFIGDFI